MKIEQTVNGLSLFTGIYGVGIGVGWETGRFISSFPWYRANVRPLIQDALGAKRDEQFETPLLDQLIEEIDKK